VTKYEQAVKALTDVLALYTRPADWEYPNRTLRDAMVVLMDAYDEGASITLSHANWIDEHRDELLGRKRIFPWFA
jgi:hypothetical protein